MISSRSDIQCVRSFIFGLVLYLKFTITKILNYSSDWLTIRSQDNNVDITRIFRGSAVSDSVSILTEVNRVGVRSEQRASVSSDEVTISIFARCVVWLLFTEQGLAIRSGDSVTSWSLNKAIRANKRTVWASAGCNRLAISSDERFTVISQQVSSLRIALRLSSGGNLQWVTVTSNKRCSISLGHTAILANMRSWEGIRSLEWVSESCLNRFAILIQDWFTIRSEY